MTPFLQIEALTKSVGTRMLFADADFGVAEGDKIGIVAKNGSGKTTLLRIIAGEESPDSGRVVWRNGLKTGYLPQHPSFNAADTVWQACLGRDAGAVARMVLDYETALASGDADAVARQSARMDAASAWNYEDKLRSLLTLLHIDISDGQTMGMLSGGQRKRVALAAVVMQDPDVIILDEPTNHLDIDVIEWLENYLKRSRATLLMVTHDRYFLERICNRILEIDNGQVFLYDGGGYDNYLRRRNERIEAMAAEQARLRNILRREQEWMSRQPQARAGKAQYRIDNFYELSGRIDRTGRQRRSLELDGMRSTRIGSKIFEAENICKRFGDKVILKDFSYTFARGEKVGIVGANGVGKSTFIKMLLGLVEADSGEWNVGETVRFGYYSQDGIELDGDKKVIDAISEIADDIEWGDTRLSPMQFLQHFMFSVPDQQKYINTLSGGERCRLHLATVLMMCPNFLILDEPTNDLDIVTLGLLEDYLSKFRGCVIVVSHDRYFLDNIVDHIFVMQGDGVVRDFAGGYSDYRRYLESLTPVETSPKTVVAKSQPRTSRPAKLSYKEQRELEAMTAEIDALTAEKAEIESLFNNPPADADINALSARYKDVGDRLDECEMRWLELSEKADAMN